MARRICCVLGLSPELEVLDGLFLNFQSSWNILGKFVVAIPWNGNSSRLALSRWQSPEFPQFFNSGQNTDAKAALALGIYISKVHMKSLDFEGLKGDCRGANDDWRDDKQTETRPDKSEIYICSFHVSSSPASRACFKKICYLTGAYMLCFWLSHIKRFNFLSSGINKLGTFPFVTFTDFNITLIMKSFLPISSHSSFLVFFLSSSRTPANPLPPPANPQLDFSSEPGFISLTTPNVDFLLPQQEQQQPFPLDDATTKSNTFFLFEDKNDEPTTILPSLAHPHCNTLLHPRRDDSAAEPAMCPIKTEEPFYPVRDWDPNEAWKEYIRKYPPDGTLVLPAEEDEGNQALKDESIGTECPDPYHQDHLCCAGPAGKIGVLSLRPNDISYIQHCASCMWEIPFFFFRTIRYCFSIFISISIFLLSFFYFYEACRNNVAHSTPHPPWVLRKEEGSKNKANEETGCS